MPTIWPTNHCIAGNLAVFPYRQQLSSQSHCHIFFAEQSWWQKCWRKNGLNHLRASQSIMETSVPCHSVIVVSQQMRKPGMNTWRNRPASFRCWKEKKCPCPAVTALHHGYEELLVPWDQDGQEVVHEAVLPAVSPVPDGNQPRPIAKCHSATRTGSCFNVCMPKQFSMPSFGRKY